MAGGIPSSDDYSHFWEQAMRPLALPAPGDVHVTGDGDAGISSDPDGISIPTDQGDITIQFTEGDEPEDDSGADLYSAHNENIANLIDQGVRGIIADDLLQGIEQDDRSRQKWLTDRGKGIDLLAIALEGPRSDLTSGSNSTEGMSTIRNPMLLEAVLRFQANARGELLPASGPVKVKNGGGGEGIRTDEDATALEADMNTYLTVTAPEYYPDTDKLLFSVGFGGCGFKKIYHCPVRQRPVSESVDAQEIIVNNSATDLRNAARVTHRIKMSPSLMQRMQWLGVYRSVDLTQTPTPKLNIVDEKIAKVTGVSQQASMARPHEHDYTLYETLTELDIGGFEDIDETTGEPTGLKLPYRVTIDLDSREILEIRRNWAEGDPQKQAKRVYVKYPFVPALGFYDLGLLHILGNATAALTAAWRICLDKGMFSNFPGFLYSKQGVGRQLTNEFRVMPGSGVGLDIGGNDIRQATMPLPYGELGPAFPAFIEAVQQVLQRVGGTAETNVGEGRADAPVGTAIALIEQAKVILDAVHKRLHAAQAEEFQLLKERFREDPDAFWRHNNSPIFPQDRQRLLDALENNELVPVADPNIPSTMHRHAKIAALMQLVQQFPQLFDIPTVLQMVLKDMKFDNPQELLAKGPPPPPPPDPKLMIAQMKSQDQLQQLQSDAQIQAADRKSRENLALLRLASTQVIHPQSASLANNPVIPPEMLQNQ